MIQPVAGCASCVTYGLPPGGKDPNGGWAAAGISEADGVEFRRTHGMTRPSSGLEVVWTDRPVAVLHRNAALTVLSGRVDDATMATVEAALSPAGR